MVRGRRLVIAPALLLVVVLLPSVVLGTDTAAFQGVDEAARDAVGSGDIPGVVVLIGRGDRILYEKAFGSRTLLPEPRSMTLDTIFDIASLTKPVGTTLAMMSLVERGMVKLEAPLGRYLREFKGSAFQGVTIRRLLTHSAGLPAIPPPGTVVAFPKYAKTLARLKLDYPPGTASPACARSCATRCASTWGCAGARASRTSRPI